jgi:hypothetical protein
MKTRCLISRTIGSYLLRVANLNAKAMFLNIPKTKQAAILCIKIQEIDFKIKINSNDGFLSKTKKIYIKEKF